MWDFAGRCCPSCFPGEGPTNKVVCTEPAANSIVGAQTTSKAETCFTSGEYNRFFYLKKIQ